MLPLTLRLSLFYWAGLIALLLPVALTAQSLQPGFNKGEYAELMKVSARTTNDSAYAAKLPPPLRFSRSYRSPVTGLDNLWELWGDGNGTIAVSIRGTTKKSESWLENFYAAMVPATGTLKLPGGQPFDYRLAPHPRAAVHVGWLIGMASMAGDIVAKIDSACRSGARNLLVMGHSQGGAIAYLLTAHLYQLQRENRLPASLRIKTYCSAAPKPGNLPFAHAFEAMTFGGHAFNVVNSADWVPETPFSIQTLNDLNKVNPFVQAKGVIRKQKFPVNLAFRHVFNRLDKTTRKADRTYRKYLGKMVGKRVSKLLPGLEVPAYVASNSYVRAGQQVVLLADSAYFRLYSDTSANVFVHHLHAPYLHLLEQLPDVHNPSVMNSNDTLEGRWELAYVAGATEPVGTAFPNQKPFIQLDLAAARVSGSTGCNRFSGAVEAADGRIRFAGQMALTKMYCPGTGEQLFLAALGQVNGYEISKDNILSLRNGDTVVMRLERK